MKPFNENYDGGDAGLSHIKELFSRDTLLKSVSQKGNCRRWTHRAMDILQPEGYLCEAREVDIGLSLSHTFLRVDLNGDNYILDGVGVESHDPYYGLEENAPSHLSGSHSDVINVLRRM